MDLQDWLFYCTQSPIAAKLCGWGLLCYGAWSYFVRPGVKRLISMVQSSQHMSEVLPVLVNMADQFKPNGGNSLRDVVDRISQNQIINTLRHRTICAHLDLATFEADAKGKYTFVSRPWCNFTNMVPSQALGDGWIASVHPDDRDKVVAEWQHAIEDNREFYAVYRVLTFGQGGIVRLASRAFPAVGSTADKLVGFVGVTTIAV